MPHGYFPNHAPAHTSKLGVGALDKETVAAVAPRLLEILLYVPATADKVLAQAHMHSFPGFPGCQGICCIPASASKETTCNPVQSCKIDVFSLRDQSAIHLAFACLGGLNNFKRNGLMALQPRQLKHSTSC